MKNRTMVQYFEWYLPADGKHWDRAKEAAAWLKELGVTEVWLPPAYKGKKGIEEEGYAVYDLYDLGEFDQKGSIKTKYGSKEEYVEAIRELQSHGIQVLADIVFNHRIDADEPEKVLAVEYDRLDRTRKIGEPREIKAWTRFTFPGRAGKYSDFVWDKTCFSSVDFDGKTNTNGLHRFYAKNWSSKVSGEKGGYDFLMGADVYFLNPKVRRELKRWGKWYIDQTGIDGVRIDAVKHITYAFYPEWLDVMRRHSGKPFFAVGEYWEKDILELKAYLDHCGRCMSLFDVPLHSKFEDASLHSPDFDLSTIFDDTLVKIDPDHAVTFVDNHDTVPSQALQSWVQAWFRPLAYALILLRRDGVPCVFYSDLYGSPKDDIHPMGQTLEKLMKARQRYATGGQTDYFDHANTVGWTRESGMAVVINNGESGWKRMYTGNPGQVYVDLLGSRSEEITVGGDGWADFTVNGRSVSVWVPKE